MSAKLWPPPPSSRLADKKIEVDFVSSPFFIHIPIEPECSKIDNLDFKKRVVVDLSDTCISKNVMVTKTQIYIIERLF